MSSTRTIVITGASSGIGFAASRQLAAEGAQVVMVPRDPVRGAAAREAVASIVGAPEPIFIAADLFRQDSIHSLDAQLHARFSSIDVLIKNAGTASASRELTIDGFERTIAVNHLAPFLLTDLVRDLLGAAPAARVINRVSETHSRRLEFDNCRANATTTSSPPTCARKPRASSSLTSSPGAWKAPV